MEPRNRLTDDFILSLTGKRRPKVCFLPTASGDAVGYIRSSIGSCRRSGCGASNCACSSAVPEAPEEIHSLHAGRDLRGSGGNTAKMLAVWRRHAIDKAG